MLVSPRTAAALSCLKALCNCWSCLNSWGMPADCCCRLIADRQAINLQLIGVLLPPVVSQPSGDAAVLQVLLSGSLGRFRHRMSCCCHSPL